MRNASISVNTFSIYALGYLGLRAVNLVACSSVVAIKFGTPCEPPQMLRSLTTTQGTGTSSTRHRPNVASDLRSLMKPGV